MAVFFNLLPLEPRSRMTGVWTSRVPDYGNNTLHMCGHFIMLGAGQDADVEWDFIGSHLPFHSGGLTGVGPGGTPWVFIIQVAPDLGDPDAAVDRMTDAVSRVLDFNPEAWLCETVSLTREELVSAFADAFVNEDDVADWSFAELVFGLLAECCNVHLPQIAVGRVGQCAFPDDEHECTHEVFTDVFARWMTGALMIDESTLDDDDEDETEEDDDDWAQQFVDEANEVRPVRKIVREPVRYPKRILRKTKTSRLRLMAVAAGWGVDMAEQAKRKQLINALRTRKRRIGTSPHLDIV